MSSSRKRCRKRLKIRKRIVHTNGRSIPGQPFTGEMMTCVMCGRQEQSSPGRESQWRAIQPPAGPIYYACPDEFPADDEATQEAFKGAYLKIFRKIFSSQSL